MAPGALRAVLTMVIIASILTPALGTTTAQVQGGVAYTASKTIDPNTTTSMDVSNYTVDVVGEKVGSLQGQSFAGWYTDTAVVDPDTGTVVVAWARWNVDEEGTDSIYIAFLKPVDADGDGDPEAYQKIMKYVDGTTSLKSLDSLTLGTINGKKYVLLTWTYYDSTEKNNVKAALYGINGTFQWKANVRSTTAYEEYSRSCYVPSYNGGNGGFLIVWFTGYDNSIDGKWLYYSGGWVLTDVFDVDDTNDLYYTKADQMLCIGGNSKALVVFRKWDGTEGNPDLYAALVDTGNNVQVVKLYDYDGSEETVGVRGAYTSGYFIVPLVSGTHLRYDIVKEADGTVYNRDYVTSNGEHPYAIALSDRFVLAWIDHYNDADGEPKIANIDLTNFYIHPQHGVSITGGDSYYDKHSIIAFFREGTLNRTLYVWSNSSDGSDYDIKYAIVDLNDPIDEPSVSSTGVLVQVSSDQRAHGLGLTSKDEYVVVYTDTEDGEEDLMAFAALPGAEEVSDIRLYFLPENATEYNQTLFNMVDSAESNVFVAVAFFQDTAFADELCSAKDGGKNVKVIMDNSTGNLEVYEKLRDCGVDVINDSTSTTPYHIMHDKFIIVDNETLMVGTVNLIPADYTRNNNTAILINGSKAVTYFYLQEFVHMWNNSNGRFGTDKTDDHSFLAFVNYTGGSSRLIVFEGYFTPQWYGCRGRLADEVSGLITRAKEAVYYTAYVFSNSSWVKPVYNATVNRWRASKVVKGVFDDLMNLDSPGKAIYDFVKVGMNSTIAINDHPYKMHDKLFVVDNKTAVIGSWNPTSSATTNHDENYLVIKEDVTNGFSAKVAEHILKMFNTFPKASETWIPGHPVINEVMFKPEVDPDGEWVEIYNPTNTVWDLSNYLIGDAENVTGTDDEGMYRFPEGAKLGAGGYVIVAYNATEFKSRYGFWPSFEIVNSADNVTDLVKVYTDKFTGDWSLDDSGDEVLLIEDQNGFLVVVDAVWYGSSTYLPDPVDISSVDTGQSIERSYPANETAVADPVFTVMEAPDPVPEVWLTSIAALIALTLAFLIYWRRR